MLDPETLAYLHPAGMLLILALAVVVLREGIQIRRSRLAQRPIDARRHRRLGRYLVLGALIGFGAGMASMVGLRNQPLARSVHFPFAVAALVGLTAAGLLGLRLEVGAGMTTRGAHATLGALGVLFALGAAVAGMAILP